MKLIGIAALAACGSPASAPVGSRVGPALAAAFAAADQSREPWRCAATEVPGLPAETLSAGAHRWRVEGHTLTLDGTGDAAVGVIADAAGSSPATLAALGRLRAQLDHVDLVIALGGMGATQAELDAVLVALADHAPWPLIVLPGDLEPVEAEAEAVAAARQRGAPVLDGRLVQRVELPAATIGLIAGAGAASRLVSGADGCSYRAADAAAVFTDLTGRPGLRIIASTEPPRAGLPGASDEPTGEMAITAAAGQEIDIALYGPTSTAASPARTGRRDGSAIPLTPGSSDALPRLTAPQRRPTAGILALRGGSWAWTPVEDK